VAQADSELSEIFLRAFILRRVALIADHRGDGVLIGSSYSAATLRIREFLTRNGQPHTYLDVEDPAVQALLDRFHPRLEDVPVVICRYDRVLKNPTNERLKDVEHHPRSRRKASWFLLRDPSPARRRDGRPLSRAPGFRRTGATARRELWPTL